MSEVSSIRGEPVAHPGKPDEAVIKELEELLKKIQDGEITGLAWSAEHADHTSTNHYVGRASRSQLGGLYMLMQRMAAQLNDG